jgi:hypothetical protein
MDNVHITLDMWGDHFADWKMPVDSTVRQLKETILNIMQERRAHKLCIPVGQQRVIVTAGAAKADLELADDDNSLRAYGFQQGVHIEMSRN